MCCKKVKKTKQKKYKNKTAELIIEINLGAATCGILKYCLIFRPRPNVGLIKLDNDVLFHLHFTFERVTDRLESRSSVSCSLIKSGE